MYLVIFDFPGESEVYYFKNKRDIKKFFSFEEICLSGNCEIYKSNKIEKPFLFLK